MNGSRAKKIRKKVYGDDSKRSRNEYRLLERVKTLIKKYKDGEAVKDRKIEIKTGQLLCAGKRAEYRKAKKAYLKELRRPCKN